MTIITKKKQTNKQQNNVLTHESMFYNVKRSQILLIKPQYIKKIKPVCKSISVSFS